MHYSIKPGTRVLVFLFVIIFAGACSGKAKKSWTTEEHKVFMQTCVDNSKEGLGEDRSNNYCQCMMEKIERIYPNADDAGKITMTQTMEMAKDCLNKFPASTDTLQK